MVQITKKLKGLNMWEACKIVKGLAKKKKNPKPTNNLCLHDVPQFFVACRIQHGFVN